MTRVFTKDFIELFIYIGSSVYLSVVPSWGMFLPFCTIRTVSWTSTSSVETSGSTCSISCNISNNSSLSGFVSSHDSSSHLLFVIEFLILDHDVAPAASFRFRQPLLWIGLSVLKSSYASSMVVVIDTFANLSIVSPGWYHSFSFSNRQFLFKNNNSFIRHRQRLFAISAGFHCLLYTCYETPLPDSVYNETSLPDSVYNETPLLVPV